MKENCGYVYCLSRPDIADRGVFTVKQLNQMNRDEIILSHKFPLDHEDEAVVKYSECLNCKSKCPDWVGNDKK